MKDPFSLSPRLRWPTVNALADGRASTASGWVSPRCQLPIWPTTASLSRLCQHEPNARCISIMTSRQLPGRRAEFDCGHKGAGHGARWAGESSQPAVCVGALSSGTRALYYFIIQVGHMICCCQPPESTLATGSCFLGE